MSTISKFLKSGFVTDGFFTSTCEDPSIQAVLLTRKDNGQKHIGFFWGVVNSENCIGMITEDTDFSQIDTQVRRMSVHHNKLNTNKSVWNIYDEYIRK